ncbi:hypothetical protein BJX61DRAFT_53762 [Aspergillus egyptiacus]|nr:hypothetical protein BJX61DRAFT_53762 [Aspergillus egyptiacus]
MSLFRNCGRTAVQLRGFSSTSRLRVEPESPDFVKVPQPIEFTTSKPRVKGTLPVPRELFPSRRKDKPTEQYISAATPLPATQKGIRPGSKDAEYRQWKREMADMRRQNFREGLLELHDRKLASDRTMEQRSREKQKRRERVLQQPERDDERLTRPSILQDMLPKRMPVLPDPDREQRLATARERLENKKLQKQSERQDSLHTLYINARTFITTEAQLLAEIDEVFPEGENEAWRSDHQQGDNIWNLGTPPTVNSLLGDGRKSEYKRWDVTQERVKKLGEEITGGKL